MAPVDALVGPGRTRRREARAARRAKLNARAVTRIDPSSAPREPSSSPPLALFVGLSLLAHPAAVVLLSLLPKPAAVAEPTTVNVQINLPDPPKTEPLAEPPKPDVPDPVPRLVEARKIETRPALTTPKVDTPPPPPDPIDLTPPTTTPNEPPKRVVGVSMESTTTGGGPSFAVGNTRMGETAGTASDPNGVGKLAGSLTPARRTSSRPPVYPPALRAQNVEGDVGLRVEVDASGHVTSATVVRSSGHEEFDRSAIEAARASTYEPARAGGTPVAQSLEFTVRFRLH